MLSGLAFDHAASTVPSIVGAVSVLTAPTVLAGNDGAGVVGAGVVGAGTAQALSRDIAASNAASAHRTFVFISFTFLSLILIYWFDFICLCGFLTVRLIPSFLGYGIPNCN